MDTFTKNLIKDLIMSNSILSNRYCNVYVDMYRKTDIDIHAYNPENFIKDYIAFNEQLDQLYRITNNLEERHSEVLRLMVQKIKDFISFRGNKKEVVHKAIKIAEFQRSDYIMKIISNSLAQLDNHDADQLTQLSDSYISNKSSIVLSAS